MKDGKYLPGQKFNPMDQYKKWTSPYQFSTPELEVYQKEHINPAWTRTILLSTAQTPQAPLLIENPGRAFRMAGFTTATGYDPALNTGIETTVTSAFVGVWINKVGDLSDAIYIKNGGGFRGDFLRLYLFWPAQASNSARITIYKYDGTPWQSGDTST